jgi:TonB family protein
LTLLIDLIMSLLSSTIKTTAALMILFFVPSHAAFQDRPKTVYKKSDEVLANISSWTEPEYPAIARVARAGGQVTVEIKINEQGVVTAARAISGHPLLQAPTIQAARQWKFHPFRESGRLVRVIGHVSYEYPKPEVEFNGKSLSQLERTVRLRPRSALSRYELGAAYFHAGRYEDAVTQLTRATRINTRYADAYMKLGFAYMRLRLFPNALGAFSEAARLEPQRSEALHARGVTRALLEQYEEAIIDLKESLKLEDPITSSYFLIGKCYVMLGRPDEAVEYYKQGLSTFDQTDARYGLGEAYFALGRFADAVTELQRALELSEGPGAAATHYLLGRSYLKLDDIEAALREYEALRKFSESLADLLLAEIKKQQIEQNRTKG